MKLKFRKNLLLTLVACFSMSAIQPSYANFESLRNMPEDLYEQPMIYDLGFDSLSLEEQNKKLIDDYLQKKKLPIWESFLRSATTAAAVTTATGLLGGYYWYSNRNAIPSPNGATKTELAGTGIAGLTIMNLVSTEMLNAKKYYEDYRNPKLRDPLQPIELEYIVKKRFLGVGLQRQIEDQLRQARVEASHMGQTTELVRLAMRMPQKSKKARFDRDIINELFEGYPEPLRKKVERFCIRQVLNQTSGDDHREYEAKLGKRAAAYFYGAPGSGKTRFAELIAKSLDLPFARISIEGASISDLVGRSTTSGNPTPGLIVSALAKAQTQTKSAKNTVLFIDEADRVINDKTHGSSEILPFMLKLLDPENKSFHSPYFDDEIDTSRLIIILAGNTKIEDEALRKRMFVINFKGFTQDYKQKIIWEDTIPKKCKDYSQSGDYRIGLDDFTREDRAIINQLIEADRDPGFRTIESVLSEYMDYIADRKYFNSQAEAPELLKFVEDSNRRLQEIDEFSDDFTGNEAR